MRFSRLSFLMLWLSLDSSAAFLTPCPFIQCTKRTESSLSRIAVASEDIDFVVDFDPADYMESDDDEEDIAGEVTESQLSKPRWHSLDPKTKAKIIAEGQAKAIRNKEKREPAQQKKRRLMMHFAKLQKEKKKANRVKRDIPFAERKPLSDLSEDEELTGKVISLTPFGAYVDVGTECDGLLHISQISTTFFVEHPRQVFKPGDEVTVKVRSFSPEKKKLHLTMLSGEVLAQQRHEADHGMEDRIPLDEIEVDDELWGELKRVTDYGAYVEVGARVDAWLHFMDHPAFAWSNGEHPSEYMSVGDRVRVWVADVDHGRQRIKLTANRPDHLPGPRRELY